MSNIKDAFSNGKAFIGFLTAGDPSLEKTVEYILEMERGGATLVEIGIPFSDPIAEGPVIQEANIRALEAGMKTEDVFIIVQEVRKVSKIPLVFLTYLNPVFHYGYKAFFKRCKETGVDGIIIPDLPYEEKQEVDSVCSKYDIDLISLITPTSKERALMIAKEAKGFIYLVSSMGVTGMRNNITTDLQSIINDIKTVSEVPVAIGFGINTVEQVEHFSKMADGVIVGSAIVNIIKEHGTHAKDAIYQYVKTISAPTK